MKLLDYLFFTYYIVVRRAPRNQFQGAVFLTTMYPLLYVVLGVFFYFSSFSSSFNNLSPGYSTIVFCIVALVVYMIISNFIIKRYQKRIDDINLKCDKLDKYYFLFFVLLILLVIFSHMIFFYTLAAFVPVYTPTP